jgi:hypothetical protein
MPCKPVHNRVIKQKKLPKADIAEALEAVTTKLQTKNQHSRKKKSPAIAQAATTGSTQHAPQKPPTSP